MVKLFNEEYDDYYAVEQTSILDTLNDPIYHELLDILRTYRSDPDDEVCATELYNFVKEEFRELEEECAYLKRSLKLLKRSFRIISDEIENVGYLGDD